jgi:hypothetical protein
VGDRSDAAASPAHATVGGTAAEENGKDEIRTPGTSEVEQPHGGRTPVLLGSWHTNSQPESEYSQEHQQMELEVLKALRHCPQIVSEPKTSN